MFDQNQKPNPGIPPSNNLTPKAAPPMNLPVAAEPEDILADVDVRKQSIKKPDVASSIMTNSPTSTPPAEIKEPFFKRYQKFIVLAGIALVVVAAIAVGGYYLMNRLNAPKNNQNTNQGDLTGNQATNQDSNNQNTNGDSVANTNINQSAEDVDVDHDGLTDKEEALYGTNPNKVDTDDDGLTDRDEVKVFKTDPTNQDTDGDSYKDGDEVRNGFDPKGAGKLLNIQ